MKRKKIKEIINTIIGGLVVLFFIYMTIGLGSIAGLTLGDPDFKNLRLMPFWHQPWLWLLEMPPIKAFLFLMLPLILFYPEDIVRKIKKIKIKRR